MNNKTIKNFIALIALVLMLAALNNCPQSQLTDQDVYPRLYIDNENTDFGEVKIGESKTLKIDLSTDSEDDFWDNPSSKYYEPHFKKLNIESIFLDDKINFFLDTSGLKSQLDFDDKTSFNVVFRPLSSAAFKVTLKIEYKKNGGNTKSTVLSGTGIN